MALKPGDGLATWELATAKRLVTEFRRRFRILDGHDFDDLVQDCLLHWVGVRNKVDVDPNDPPVGFMAKVLRNKLTDSIRQLGCDKRVGDLILLSLDAPADSAEDATEDGPSLGESLHHLLDEQPSMDSDISLGLQVDFQRVLPLLTEPQQRLCRLIGLEGLSIKEAAEQLCIPRGTLYEEIRRIRQLFESQGLDAYLWH